MARSESRASAGSVGSFGSVRLEVGRLTRPERKHPRPVVTNRAHPSVRGGYRGASAGRARPPPNQVAK
jgi:hypothetical protein